MTIPPRQSSLWNNNARLARSRSDSKKTRHRCCLTRIGRQNKALAYLNWGGAVNKKILKTTSQNTPFRFSHQLPPLPRLIGIHPVP
jgi:hypothetical protein